MIRFVGVGTVCLLFGLGGSCGFTCFGLVGAFSKTGLSLFQVPFPGSGYVMSYYVFKTPSPLAPVVRSPPCHATSSSSPTRGAPKPCTHDAHLFFQRPPYACTSKCMSVISPPLSGAAAGCVRGPPLLRTRRRHRVDADQPGPMSAKTLCSPCADSRCPVEFEKKTFLPLCMRRRVSDSLPADAKVDVQICHQFRKGQLRPVSAENQRGRAAACGALCASCGASARWGGDCRPLVAARIEQ